MENPDTQAATTPDEEVLPPGAFKVPEEMRQQLNAEIEHEAQRLALVRELKEKGDFHTVSLSSLKGVGLGSFLWFDTVDGTKRMVQVLEIDYEGKTVGVRALLPREVKKVKAAEAMAAGGNRKARRAAKKVKGRGKA